jgi:hypothetical protein
MSKIYKYFSHDVMELVFQREAYCGIKCSFPKDYNDPYELFLGVDVNVSTEFLATYKEIVQEIPQYPTSCFSKSPIISPMWAHYAKDHSGFVLEFDTEELKEHFKEISIQDVSYRDEPNKNLADLLARASVARKPRHAYWLQQAVLFEAYFSKYTNWNYEQEVRLVDAKDYAESVGSNKVLFIPTSCVTAVIVGNKFPSDKIDLSMECSDACGVEWYRLNMGKSYPVPHMRDRAENPYIFDQKEIIPAKNICESCSEPLLEERGLCPWCSITEAHELEAAQGNPFRVLAHYGMLDQYLESAGKIGVRGEDQED